MSEPVCKTCNDTHLMWMESLGRKVGCTVCPRPCRSCAGGAYCATTPCTCACHKPAPPPAEAKHTPGPWRWEVSRKSKNVRLCGGVPRFDLTVVDFKRWGTHSATLRLREDEAGFNIMERPHERDGWVVPIKGREHHADWCATLDHPDARLIAAAPDLLAALERLLAVGDDDERIKASAQARAAIAAAKGGAR